MSRRRRSKKENIKVDAAELNIMPFIDVFSVLTTFLLMSAVFLSIGIIKVQVPFFAPEKKVKEKPVRSLSIDVDLQVDKIQLNSKYSMAPVDSKSFNYEFNEVGMEALHKRLVVLRLEDEKNDLVTLFSDDDVIYDDVTKVLDVIKFRRPSDPVFTVKDEGNSSNKSKERETQFLFPKVVMGSVVL